MGEELLRLSLNNLHKGYDDVGFGDDPQHSTLLNDGQAANSPFEDEAGRIGDRGFWSHSDHLFRHDILHRNLLERVMGILVSGPRCERRRKD